MSQLQHEIMQRNEELNSARSGLTTLENKHSELQQQYEACLKQNALLREESERSKSEIQQLRESSAEVTSLQETNEHLKSQLEIIESKYVKAASLNSELQKKVEIMEQQQIQKDSV